MKKGEVNDLKNRYSLFLKSALLSTLLMFLFLFLFLPGMNANPYVMLQKSDVTVMTELPDEMQKVNEPEQIAKPNLPRQITETDDQSQVTDSIAIITTFGNDDEFESEDNEVYLIYETPPKQLNRVQISYPENARFLGIEGTVYVDILIEKDGRVSKATVKKGVHPTLDEAAISYAYNLSFTPAMSRDLPVRCIVTLPIRFKLVD